MLDGRNPDEWFCERADYISEIKKIKHPYDKGIGCKRGDRILMEFENVLPSEIEKRSFEIIESELPHDIEKND